MRRNTVAVLISDVHYSLPTLDLADASLQQAIRHAEKLSKPLIIAGDLHDTKGTIRAECASRLISTLTDARCLIYVLVGNHDLINEKGKAHALTFISHLANIVVSPINYHGLYLIPYETDQATLLSTLSGIPKGSTLIMHTGVKTAYMGHYTQDKSSLPPEAFSDFRVVSGHYHRRQDIPCGNNVFSYIGNPYTLNYGESQDGPKGYQILWDDGSLQFCPTNLRKHVVVARTSKTIDEPITNYQPGDLVKIKVSGPKSELDLLDKHIIGMKLLGHVDFKLDLISDTDVPNEGTKFSRLPEETLDALIDDLKETPERKQVLKDLWRSL